MVSCIMPTANRRAFVPAAIEMFLRQTYADKELIIVDDGEDSVADLIPAEPSIRYIRESHRISVGHKRNLACDAARGEVVLHWDDDDWYAPWRIQYQVDQLTMHDLELSGLNSAFFVEPVTGRAWRLEKPANAGPIGATFCYRRSLWRSNPFPKFKRRRRRCILAPSREQTPRDLRRPALLRMPDSSIEHDHSGPRRSRSACRQQHWLPLDIREVRQPLGFRLG